MLLWIEWNYSNHFFSLWICSLFVHAFKISVVVVVAIAPVAAVVIVKEWWKHLRMLTLELHTLIFRELLQEQTHTKNQLNDVQCAMASTVTTFLTHGRFNWLCAHCEQWKFYNINWMCYTLHYCNCDLHSACIVLYSTIVSHNSFLPSGPKSLTPFCVRGPLVMFSSWPDCIQCNTRF